MPTSLRTPLSPRRNARGFTLIELMIVVAIIGLIAAIAIPNFIKFQARSKQAEAKTNLRAAFTAQKAYFQEHSSYSNNGLRLGFLPERGNRYAYNLGGMAGASVHAIPEVDQSRSGPALALQLPYSGVEVDTFRYPTNADGTPTTPFPTFVPSGWGHNGGAAGVYATGGVSEFTVTAVGNIDEEVTAAAGYDHWLISTQSAVVALPSCMSPVSENVVGGVPFNTRNDVTCNQ